MESKSKKLNQLDSSAEETFKDESVAKQEVTTTTAPKTRQPNNDKIKPKVIKEEVVKKDKMKEKKAKEDLPPYVDAQAVQHMQERPKVAHAQNHQIAHNEAVRSNRITCLIPFNTKSWLVRILLEKLGILCSPRIWTSWEPFRLLYTGFRRSSPLGCYGCRLGFTEETTCSFPPPAGSCFRAPPSYTILFRSAASSFY